MIVKEEQIKPLNNNNNKNQFNNNINKKQYK